MARGMKSFSRTISSSLLPTRLPLHRACRTIAIPLRYLPSMLSAVDRAWTTTLWRGKSHQPHWPSQKEAAETMRTLVGTGG